MDKLERAQIRAEYCKENGYVWIKPENTEMDGYIKYLEDKLIAQQEVKNTVDLGSVIKWVAFDWMEIETRPTKHGKHLITRKDGKIHWETWNGNGWAYNHNEIRFWAEIEPPVL